VLFEPWAVAAVLRAAFELSAGEAGSSRALAVRGALVLVLLADSADEARIGLAVAREESRWNPWAVNRACDAAGGQLVCCGVGQVACFTASSCARHGATELHSWAELLRVLRASSRACRPTWERALTVYVSGRCGVALDVARARCSSVALCAGVPFKRDNPPAAVAGGLLVLDAVRF
jgi:hypothetical protein